MGHFFYWIDSTINNKKQNKTRYFLCKIFQIHAVKCFLHAETMFNVNKKDFEECIIFVKSYQQVHQNDVLIAKYEQILHIDFLFG